MHFDVALAQVLDAEGGLLVDPGEPGGASFRGVSLTAFREFRKDSNLIVADLIAMSPEETAQIYRLKYWDLISGDDIKGKFSAIALFNQVANRGVEGLRSLLIETLNNRYKQNFTPGASFTDLISSVNLIEDKTFALRFIKDAEHSYSKIAWGRYKSGKLTFDQAAALDKMWRIRCHNLYTLLVQT